MPIFFSGFNGMENSRVAQVGGSKEYVECSAAISCSAYEDSCYAHEDRCASSGEGVSVAQGAPAPLSPDLVEKKEERHGCIRSWF